MHDYRQLACERHGRPFETEPFFERQRPGAQPARLRRRAQDNRGSLVEQAPQLIVAATRDMAFQLRIPQGTEPALTGNGFSCHFACGTSQDSGF